MSDKFTICGRKILINFVIVISRYTSSLSNGAKQKGVEALVS